MRKRDDYDLIAGKLAAVLLDNACPHGGGGNMGNDCQMCVLAALRSAAKDGAKVMRERAWERRVKRALLSVRRGGP
jgi:hypothetical protein